MSTNTFTVFTDSNNVVTSIVNTAVLVSNGYLVTDSTGEYIISTAAFVNVYPEVVVASGIVPQAYLYTSAGGFVANPNYVPYVSTDQKIADLQSALLQAQNAINTLLGV